MKSSVIFFLTFCLLLLISLSDYLTGYEISLGFFYLFPIAIAAWHLGRGRAFFFVMTSTLLRAYIDHINGHPHVTWVQPFWNALMRFGIFSVTAVCFEKISLLVRKQRELVHELSDTFVDAWEVGDLFPICSCCKKVRTDAAFIAQVKQFTERHPDARFVHGICPDCLHAAHTESDKPCAVGA